MPFLDNIAILAMLLEVVGEATGIAEVEDGMM
jgi:hypothetical protein